MTEGEQAYFKRRIREEQKRADTAPEPYLRDLHLGWASLYEERLNGAPKSQVRLPG